MSLIFLVYFISQTKEKLTKKSLITWLIITTPVFTLLLYFFFNVNISFVDIVVLIGLPGALLFFL